MIEFFKKIRWVNLVIIIFTMYAMRFLVIKQILMYNNKFLDKDEFFQLQLNEWCFLMLVLATVFIAAGGYIINDYFDKKIDELNNPIKKESETEEEEKFCCRKAMKYYNLFTIFGVVLGVGVSLLINQYMFGGIFLLVAGLLWFYSSTYKRIPLLGNLIVAFLSALVPLLVVIFEAPLLIEKYRDLFIANDEKDLFMLMYIILGFSIFAFMLTLIREIVKDIEDVIGDKAYGKKTLAVAFGNGFATVAAGILVVATIYFLFYFQTDIYPNIYIEPNLLNKKISFWYIIILLIAPLSYVIYRLIANTTKQGMHITSMILKLIMFFGIAYSFVLYYGLKYL